MIFDFLIYFVYTIGTLPYGIGPIGLSIMVVLSESYLQNLEKNATELALRFDIAPKPFRRYVVDSYARFRSRSNATEF